MFALSLIGMLFFANVAESLVPSVITFRRLAYKPKKFMSEKSDFEEISFDRIAVSGFLSKSSNFAEPSIFSKIFSRGTAKSITAVCDDIGFAKKRMVNPKTVYSGLFDSLRFENTAESNLNAALEGSDAWLAFNVTSLELSQFAQTAVELKLKRAVFAVNVLSDEVGENVTFDSECKTLSDAGINYTILKFADARKMGEAKFPYRIVRGTAALPTDGQVLASEDLMRVLAEVIDLPKSFNSVYGIGAGNMIDSEILVYMKSQGWPERVQVGLLLGTMMEKIEKMYEEEQRQRSTSDNSLVKKEKKTTAADLLSSKGGFAGFF